MAGSVDDEGDCPAFVDRQGVSFLLDDRHSLFALKGRRAPS
jgi:hypothetical protein